MSGEPGPAARGRPTALPPSSVRQHWALPGPGQLEGQAEMAWAAPCSGWTGTQALMSGRSARESLRERQEKVPSHRTLGGARPTHALLRDGKAKRRGRPTFSPPRSSTCPRRAGKGPLSCEGPTTKRMESSPGEGQLRGRKRRSPKVIGEDLLPLKRGLEFAGGKKIK